MNDYLERLLVENSNKCNELGAEIIELQQRIQKAIEIIDIINKQYEEIKDKDLITNRVVDISVIQEIENRLKGSDNNDK